MLKRIICTLLLVIVAFGFSVSVSADSRYKNIISMDDMTISYDTQTIKYNSADEKTVDVWIKSTYTEKGATKYIKDRRSAGQCQENKWDKFSYIVEHQLLSKTSYKTYVAYYFNTNDKPIDVQTFKHTGLINIPPSSTMEKIRDEFINFL